MMRGKFILYPVDWTKGKIEHAFQGIEFIPEVIITMEDKVYVQTGIIYNEHNLIDVTYAEKDLIMKL